MLTYLFVSALFGWMAYCADRRAERVANWLGYVLVGLGWPIVIIRETWASHETRMERFLKGKPKKE